METVREASKAVQQASKTGKAVVDAASDLGKWTAKVLGTVPEDMVGLALGDYLRELRIRNMDRIRRKTEDIPKARGIDEPDPIAPKHAIPIFEAASEETDETLQNLWARLLANAMDPNRDVHLLRVLIDTLGKFESIDALVLEHIAKMDELDRLALLELPIFEEVRRTLVQVSLDHLAELKCIQIDNDTDYTLTPIGEELWLAIQDDGGN